jgi:hypothetical protein
MATHNNSRKTKRKSGARTAARQSLNNCPPQPQQITRAIPGNVRGRISITYRHIDELKLNSRNPRKHSPRQIRLLAKSIGAFGFIVPILIDHEGMLVAGEARFLAGRKAGVSEVPTISVQHLTPVQVQAFIIADNRLSELAEWDDRVLGEQLKELSVLNLEFDLDATGFEFAEIDPRVASLATLPEGPDPADELPMPPQAGPAICQPEDLWHLGPHRLYCGNSIEEPSYVALMGGERAAMVFTDPL